MRTGSEPVPANELTPRQRALLDDWLGAWTVVADHTWPLQDTTVVHVRSAQREHVVKASTTSHHIAREIAAHLDVLDVIDGLPAPRLEFADAEAGILVTGYLPGRLLLGTSAQRDPDAFEQAGTILRLLQVPGSVSGEYSERVAAQTAGLIADAEGLVDAAALGSLSSLVDAVPRHPVRLHFTHGDYQPRNWLVHDGRVSVIDFGRGAQRSWVSDLVRLRGKDFAEHPHLEAAFLRGLGRELDDDDRDVLQLETLREAMGTVVWAHSIGDDDFEEHGRRMIRRLLGE